jgi:hypothetical protein
MKAESKAKPKAAAKAKPKAASKARPEAPAKAKPKPASKAKPKATTKPDTLTKAAKASANTSDASRLIDQRIADLGDWRGDTLARMRKLILEAQPEAIEEWKWMGTPVWSHNGILCTGESYKKVVKLTFAKGAALPDPKRLFNSSLEGNTRRAIDIAEGEQVDANAFKALVKAAASLNGLSKKKR